MFRTFSVVPALLALTIATVVASAADSKSPAFTNSEEAGPDFELQGEYEGKIGDDTTVGAHVIALGDGKFDVVFYAKGLPGAGWDGKTRVVHRVVRVFQPAFNSQVNVDQKVRRSSDVAVANLAADAPLIRTEDGAKFEAKGFSGEIKEGVFSGTTDNEVAFELKKVERKSPTLEAKPPEGAIVLFDGSSVDGWEDGQLTDDGLLSVGTRTKQKFSDFTLHLEFRTPFMPESRGQGRGNSGMYLLDQYEVQILDSFGLTGENNECGGIYSISKPAVNMCFPPLSWQTYDVEFRAARFDAEGKKTENAVTTIKHNGVVIHDKLELTHSTPGGRASDEKPPQALFLQNHGNPVNFRNIWIVEK